jgi:hypothetical protein
VSPTFNFSYIKEMEEDCIYLKEVHAVDDMMHRMCHRQDYGTHCICLVGMYGTCIHYRSIEKIILEKSW